MIKQKIDSCDVQWLVICKAENPKTKKNSGYSTDFSWELWNTTAQQYMQSIKALSYEWTLEISKEVYQLLIRWADKALSHTSLHSDDKDPGTSGDGVDGTEDQGDDDSWNSNVSAWLKFREGPPLMMVTTWTHTCSVLQSRIKLNPAKLPVVSIRAHALFRLELLPVPAPLVMTSTTSSIGTHILLTMLKGLPAPMQATKHDKGEIQ